MFCSNLQRGRAPGLGPSFPVGLCRAPLGSGKSRLGLWRAQLLLGVKGVPWEGGGLCSMKASWAGQRTLLGILPFVNLPRRT